MVKPVKQTLAMIRQRHEDTEIPGTSVATLYNDVGDLLELIDRQAQRIEDLRERIDYMGAVSKSVWEIGVEALKDDAGGQRKRNPR